MDKTTLPSIMAFLIFSIGFAAFISGCQDVSETRPTQTPPGQEVVNMQIEKKIAQRTIEAIEAAEEATQIVRDARASATAQVVQRRKTEVALQHIQATQAEQKRQTRATERAHEQRLAATEKAQNTQTAATMQASIVQATSTALTANLQATGTARFQNTQEALAVQQTQVALDLQGTAEANAIAAAKKIQDAQVEVADLAVKRERMMNKVTAVAPYAAGSILLGLFVILVYRFGKNEADRRKVIRDDDGKPHVIIDVSRQGTRFANPNRMLNPAMDMKKDGFESPQFSDPYAQAQITLFALMTEMLSGQSTPKETIEKIQTIIQASPRQHLPENQGQVIDVEVLDANSNKTASGWMSDVESDFVDGEIL